MINSYDYMLQAVTAASHNQTTHDLELWHFDDDGNGEKIDTVLHEERIWDDFCLRDYHNSQGITEKYSELANGTRIAERYDALTKTYLCSMFDRNGTLIRDEKRDIHGHFEITETIPDGTKQTTSGTSLFIRSIDGKIQGE